MTRYRCKGKSLDFPGKTELVDTIRAQEKCCEKWHKKRNVHQDISDTLKRGLASSHFLHPKREHPAVGLYMSDMSDLKKPKMFTFVDFFGDI